MILRVLVVLRIKEEILVRRRTIGVESYVNMVGRSISTLFGIMRKK